jgi:hypothetical protein
VEAPQAIKDRWCTLGVLNQSKANADGDPAEDGIEKFLKTVGRCKKGVLQGREPEGTFEGVDLESESQ